jgi:hypothetical protein
MEVTELDIVTPVHRPFLTDSMLLKASILKCKHAVDIHELYTPPYQPLYRLHTQTSNASTYHHRPENAVI